MYECILAANVVHIAPALLTDTTIGLYIEGWFVLLQLLQEQRIFPGYGVSVLGPFTFLAKDTCFTFPCRVDNRQGTPTPTPLVFLLGGLTFPLSDFTLDYLPARAMYETYYSLS